MHRAAAFARSVSAAAADAASRARAAAAALLGPEAAETPRFVRQALQFAGVCYLVDQYGFHLSMVGTTLAPEERMMASAAEESSRRCLRSL